MTISLRHSTATFVLSMVAIAGLAAASNDLNSPVGTWKTVDDKTGKTRSIVRVYEQDGRLFARVEQNLAIGDECRTCTKCTDDRKDQPLIGLVFMRNHEIRRR
jgi:hypothetical protein